VQHFQHRFVKVAAPLNPIARGSAKPYGGFTVAPERNYSATPLTKKLGAKAGAGVVVYFTTSRAELTRRFANLKRALGPADGLWIAYPKKSSQVVTDLTFDDVQRIGLAAGLVDNKSIAFDDDWSAVRFVYRVADR
jgi:hypothetical protein